MPIVPITLDHVGDHRRRGLDAAGARPLERDLADRVALEHDGVERPVDLRERVLPVDERGLDANVEAPVDESRRADEPDHHVELAGGGDVVGVDLGDAVVVDVLEVDA